MHTRARSRVLAVLAGASVLIASLVVVTATAPSTSAAPNEVVNPGSYTFTSQGGILVLSGTGGRPPGPTVPFACSDGVNNDTAIDDTLIPPRTQDALADFPADPQCASATDDSEVLIGWPPGNTDGITRELLGFSADIATDGTFSNINASFPVVYQYLSGFNGALIRLSQSVEPSWEALGMPAPSGSLNPTTGQTTLTLPLRNTVQIVGGTNIGPCTNRFAVNFSTNPAGPATGLAAEVTPTPYNPDTGRVIMADNQFVIPAFVGALCTLLNANFNLPSVAGTSAIQADLKIQPASNTQPTANPVTAPVGVDEGDTVVLNGSGTDPDAVPCDDLPCPTPGPNNFRWTQTGGPPVGAIAGADTGQPSFVVPDNGSYSFQLEVNDGTTPFFSASTQSVNFNVGSVAPTPSIQVTQSGQALSSPVVSGGSGFSLVGSSSDPAPADPDSSRTYAWTRTGGDCAAFGSFPAGGKTVNLTAPSPGSDCTAQFQLAVTDKDGATGTSSVTVTVKPAVAGRIGGVVRSCDGTNPCAPLSGAFAVLYQQTGSLAFVGVQQTAGDGSFAFDGLGAGNYRVFFTANGHTSEWLGGGSVAASSPLVSPGFVAANADLAVRAGGTGSIGGNVTLSAGGSAPNGTSVRLYNSAGFVSKTTTSGGSFTFPELKPRDDYKVLYGMGLADYQMEWYTGQYNEGLANRLTVNPGGNTAANLTLRKPVTNQVVQTGTATSGTTTALLDTGATWTPNAFAGMRITLTGGTGSGQVRTITSNTATQINVTQMWTTTPANGTTFSIAGLTDATANGVLRGWVTRQDTAAAIQPFVAGPPPVGIEARVYQADTGAYVGRVTVGGVQAGPNYSFESWVANTSLPNVSGLKPGSYKVLFRNVGQLTNGTHPYCSEWSGDVRGGTASGSWQFAEPVTVTGGQYTRLDAALAAAASCVAPLN